MTDVYVDRFINGKLYFVFRRFLVVEFDWSLDCKRDEDEEDDDSWDLLFGAYAFKVK